MANPLPFQKEPPFSHGQAPATGILLCNLGTPDAPTAPAVRRYLREFLSDPRVVEIPRAVWLPLLHGIILPLRSSRSAAATTVARSQSMPTTTVVTRTTTHGRSSLRATTRSSSGRRWRDTQRRSTRRTARRCP